MIGSRQQSVCIQIASYYGCLQHVLACVLLLPMLNIKCPYTKDPNIHISFAIKTESTGLSRWKILFSSSSCCMPNINNLVFTLSIFPFFSVQTSQHYQDMGAHETYYPLSGNLIIKCKSKHYKNIVDCSKNLQ